jgi:hypothetical protein
VVDRPNNALHLTDRVHGKTFVVDEYLAREFDDRQGRPQIVRDDPSRQLPKIINPVSSGRVIQDTNDSLLPRSSPRCESSAMSFNPTGIAVRTPCNAELELELAFPLGGQHAPALLLNMVAVIRVDLRENVLKTRLLMGPQPNQR